MKALILINEPFTEMVLGKSTTLSYILSSIELNHKTYIHQVPATGKPIPHKKSDKIEIVEISAKIAKKLIIEYKKKNFDILEALKSENLIKLATLEESKVKNISNDFIQKEISLEEIDFIIQRLEPMKSPFPPQGKENIDDFLSRLQGLFPNKIFNSPIRKEDKEIAQILDKIAIKNGMETMSIPTLYIEIEKADFSLIYDEILKYYEDFNGDKDSKKAVLKPKNSAQSFGVFAIEFSNKGLDLESLRNLSAGDLAAFQIYEIKNDLSSLDLSKITKILCYIQSLKTNPLELQKKENIKIKNIAEEEIITTLNSLYQNELLIQPFLEGIRFGDIRTNILKNEKGDFYLAGHTFRKSLRTGIQDFTTCYTDGKAAAQPITIFSKEEQEDLNKKTSTLLKILNEELREDYKNSTELGADFILVGDNKTVLLGEINHHCQALIPATEAINKSLNENYNYDGGMFLTKEAIKNLIFLQE